MKIDIECDQFLKGQILLLLFYTDIVWLNIKGSGE